MSINDQNDDNVFFENNGSENGLALIREIFDGADDLLDTELERALDQILSDYELRGYVQTSREYCLSSPENRMQTIVIEPKRLGEETARWISIGNCLNKTAVVTGFGSLITGILWPDRRSTQYCLATVSALTNGIHVLSWQMDECSHYSVETDPDRIAAKCVPLVDIEKPIVLTRRLSTEIKRNNILQTAISLLALAFTAFRLYKSFNLTKIIV